MSRIRASKTPSAYKDLGFKNPGKWEAKANLAIRINNLIESRSLTQSKSAKILGTTRPRISDLKRGQFDKFSLEKLLTFLLALDQDVEIIVHPRSSDSARIRVNELTMPPPEIR